MKKITIILIGVLLTGCGQKKIPFHVEGNVSVSDGVKVYLMQDEKTVDSTAISNHKFSLEGKLIPQQLCEIVFKAAATTDYPAHMIAGIDIFPEVGSNYTLYAKNMLDIQRRRYKLMTNSPAQLGFNKFRDLFSRSADQLSLQKKETELKRGKALYGEKDALYTAYTDSIRLLEAAERVLATKVRHRFISENPNRYAAVYLLSQATDLTLNQAFYVAVAARMREPFRSHPYGKKFLDKLERAKSLRFRNPVLKIAATDVEGQFFNYLDYEKNIFMLLHFRDAKQKADATEIRQILKMQKALAEKNVAYIVLNFNADDKASPAAAIIPGFKNSYTILGEYLANFDRLDLKKLPHYTIIDNSGQLLAYNTPPPAAPAFMQLLDKMLLLRM